MKIPKKWQIPLRVSSKKSKECFFKRNIFFMCNFFQRSISHWNPINMCEYVILYMYIAMTHMKASSLGSCRSSEHLPLSHITYIIKHLLPENIYDIFYFKPVLVMQLCHKLFLWKIFFCAMIDLSASSC